jgi:hypothetical protein
MKKLSILVMVLITRLDIFGYSINLPEGICNATEISAKMGCGQRNLTFDSKTPVFLILIHGTFSQDEKFLDDIALNKDPIPQGFFKNSTYDNSLPIKLTYSWSGKNSDSARISGGKALAHGLNNIMQQCQQAGIEPKIILMAHSHGGNVSAVASNFVTNPIDRAIFLATPVLRYDQNKKSGTENDLYLPKSIKELFLFYSMQDFVQTAGALTSDFKRRYGPITGINIYNVRLLLNGQEPLHTELYNQVIEDHALELCTIIKSRFIKNKNLVANIAPKNPQADKLVAIKKYDPVKTNPFTGKSTDDLWKNWETFTYKTGEPNEAEISDAARLMFNNIYHTEFLDTVPLVDRTVRTVQKVLCVNAVGKVGSLLAFLPNKTRKSTARFCCPFNEFKQEHPSATTALGCAKLPELTAQAPLSDEENKDLCMNVFGEVGAPLVTLPVAAKKDLKGRCCSPDFIEKHPNASKAIGC